MARRSSPRVDALLARVAPGLPIWDLCCDSGQIGIVALERDPSCRVVFVDKRADLMLALARDLARRPRCAYRYELVRADIRTMDLPNEAATFIIAGVGTNLICAFLDRLSARMGDGVICSTSQDPARFERLVAARGYMATDRLDLTSPQGRQTVWTVFRE